MLKRGNRLEISSLMERPAKKKCGSIAPQVWTDFTTPCPMSLQSFQKVFVINRGLNVSALQKVNGPSNSAQSTALPP